MVSYNQKTKKMLFEVDLTDARSVELLGEFNGWNENRHPLKKAKNGKWKIEIALTPGEHQFLYRVDHQRWMADDSAPKRNNDFGTENSVCMVPVSENKPKSKTKKNVQKKSRV
ncbi:isoamylase early set domain-containing protein [bacterium]|nr:isoamylase early set domain-containing protein [bacterium]